MLDQDSHGPTTSDALQEINQFVTLDVVSAAFEAAGLPRSLRTLQRYCSNGTLDCVKEATDTGDTYFVRSASIVPAITALRQLHEAKDRHRQPAPGSVMSNTVAGGIANHTVDDDDRPGPTATDTIVACGAQFLRLGRRLPAVARARSRCAGSPPVLTRRGTSCYAGCPNRPAYAFFF